jgi:pyruvate,water dikinase
MDTAPSLVVTLAEAAAMGEARVGGKAHTLARLIEAGYRVPGGFCITADAYDLFVSSRGLTNVIQMELGRKPLASMRWEEIWDAALRIRSAFLARPLPESVSDAVVDAYGAMGKPLLAVRSSAPGEDSPNRSYAGLHESLVGVDDADGLLDAVRVVWASLWSDAALLYRRELDLDPARSRMAVVVQALVSAECSGVAFGRDPRRLDADREIIEAVPGPCSGLVDGVVDPDRWILKRSSGQLVEWTPGRRGTPGEQPILDRPDVEILHRALASVENAFGWPPDIEWTGRSSDLTLLQARPITAPNQPKETDQREWYLSLRPNAARLARLRHRVAEELIPQLEEQIRRLESEDVHLLSDASLAKAIDDRVRTLDKWKRIYWDEFIPFAHGVRHLALYYNDAVRPDDPYEFTGILKHQAMIAIARNEKLEELASRLRENAGLRRILEEISSRDDLADREGWRQAALKISKKAGGEVFVIDFESLMDRHMNVAYGGERLKHRPDLALKAVLELARPSAPSAPGASPSARASSTRPPAALASPARTPASPAELEKRLYDAVGPDRREEARFVVETAKLSWRLRDDDNILIGRLESFLMDTLILAVERLSESRRLVAGPRVSADWAPVLAAALRDTQGRPVSLPPAAASAPPSESAPQERAGEKPRQIVGQPAAPGWAVGHARVIQGPDDLGRFRAGEVLVCDAIQPTITHLVPLACAVVERRGGMLIHGAIIAREMGIPCVNGVRDAAGALRDGDLLTVDGHLGIVTVGPPEFDLEIGAHPESPI